MIAAPLRPGSRSWRLLFWLAVLFAAVMAVLPQPPSMPTGHWGDKVEHMIAFAVLSALALLAFPAASRWRLTAGLSLFGAAIELAQAIPALGRDSDVRDWLADTVVVVAVIGPAALIGRRRAGGQ